MHVHNKTASKECEVSVSFQPRSRNQKHQVPGLIGALEHGFLLWLHRTGATVPEPWHEVLALPQLPAQLSTMLSLHRNFLKQHGLKVGHRWQGLLLYNRRPTGFFCAVTHDEFWLDDFSFTSKPFWADAEANKGPSKAWKHWNMYISMKKKITLDLDKQGQQFVLDNYTFSCIF